MDVKTLENDLVEKIKSQKGGIFPKGSLTSSDLMNFIEQKYGRENIRQLVSFVAVVPDKTPTEKTCRSANFTPDESSTRILEEIVEETIQKYNLKEARLFHIIGNLKIDDDLIYAVALGEERKETFKAIQEMIIAAKSHAKISAIYYFTDETKLEFKSGL